MANIYWMYDNKLEKADRLRPIHAVLSGGTANIYDFNLETQYKGTAIRGTHQIYVYFDGTGIHCDSAILISDTLVIGSFLIGWGTNLSGGWSWAWKAISPTGTTFLTWAGTLTYVTNFIIEGRLNSKKEFVINETFLGKRLELDSNPSYPFDAGEHRSVTIGETPKGVRHVYHNFDRKSWSLNYEGITDADKQSVEEMVDYCHGSYKPLWFTLNPSTPAETHFVRFATDRFTYQEIISGYWNTILPLEQEL